MYLIIVVVVQALILKGNVSDTIIYKITALIGIFSLSYCTQQFYKRNLRICESALFLVLAVILIYPSLVLGVIGLIGLILLILFIRFTVKKEDMSATTS